MEAEHYPLDALIIGGGLGGCLLSHFFEEAGWDYRIIDKTLPGTGWSGGPAIFSPLQGDSLRPDPLYERYYEAARKTYTGIGRKLNELLFWDTPILYRFVSEAERTRVLDGFDEASERYVTQVYESGESEEGVRLPFGGMRVKGGGSVSVSRLVSAYHRWAKTQNRLVEEPFEYDFVECYEDGVIYDDLRPSVIAFAEGGRVRHNPWFGGEIHDLHRGEIVDIGSTRDFGDLIIIGKRWLLPIADGRYFSGGVKYPYLVESEATEEARKDLIDYAEEILMATCNGFKQSSGILPFSADRRPIIGPHPDFPYLQVFNGFGDNGALQMPFWAQRFLRSLGGQSELPETVLPARFNLED